MMKKIVLKLRSIKLAVSLIFILSVLSLIGIFLPQIPAAFSSSPSSYAWWVENVAAKELGTMVYTLEPLGLFHVFRSVWFVVAAALLLLNILVCTLSRVGALRLKAEKAAINTDSEFYQSGRHVFAFDVSSAVSKVGEAALKQLESHHYSAQKKDAPGCIYIAGDKHRLSSWGTLSVHLSLIVLLVGILAGSFFGFREESFVVAEGAAEAVGNGTGLSIRLNSFTDDYWENGTPKEYRSEVDILENGRVVRSGSVRVNHPLTYKGVRIHQGFFGQAVSLKISDIAGAVVYSGSAPLTGIRKTDSLERPEGETILPDSKYHVIILGPATNGADPYIGKDEIGIEFYDADMSFLGWLVLEQNTPQQLGDLSFSFQNAQFSGFMVSRDPGASFVWAAAVLFLLGLGMIFYFPHRKVWLLLAASPETGTKVIVKFDALREYGMASEAEPLLKALGMEEKPEGRG